MENIKDQLVEIASKVKINTKLRDSEYLRAERLLTELALAGISASCAKYAKPHTGASFRVKEFKKEYRINYKSGYGRHNYAPVLIISKSQFKN